VGQVRKYANGSGSGGSPGRLAVDIAPLFPATPRRQRAYPPLARRGRGQRNERKRQRRCPPARSARRRAWLGRGRPSLALRVSVVTRCRKSHSMLPVLAVDLVEDGAHGAQRVRGAELVGATHRRVVFVGDRAAELPFVAFAEIDQTLPA